MLDVRRLRLLRELSIRGTIAEVAAALHQSPSAVSQQLSQLEREVGAELLRKTGRRLQLTAQAEILVEHAGRILDQLDRAESELAVSQHEAVGTARVAVFQSAALALMPDTLTALAAGQPRLRVTMTQREPETALYDTWARDFDLVVAEQYPGHAAPRHPDLDRVDLMVDALRLAVPAADSAWSSVGTIADAAQAPWVMEPHGAASRHWAEQTCRVAGFEPDVRYETADLQAHVALVESGNAVALLPDLMSTLRPAAVRMVELAGSPSRTIFTAARRAVASRPAIVATREALASAVARRAGDPAA